MFQFTSLSGGERSERNYSHGFLRIRESVPPCHVTSAEKL